MAIRFCPAPTFVAPVKLTIPGKSEMATLQIEFRHKTVAELEILFASWIDRQGVQAISHALANSTDLIVPEVLVQVMALADLHAGRTSIESVLGAIVQGWPDGPLYEDGTPVPYTLDNLAALIQAYPAARKEITHQYIHALTESRLGK